MERHEGLLQIGADGAPYIVILFQVEAEPKFVVSGDFNRVFLTLGPAWLEMLQRALERRFGEVGEHRGDP